MSFKEFKPYPKYKDSGVEWLGEVPEHWRVMPFFTQAQERKEPNKGMLENNLLSLSYGSIVPKDINTDEGLLPESFESYQIVHPDDIVFRLTDLQNDKRSLRSAICKELGIITSAYLVVRTQGLDSNYLNYLMRSYDVMKVFYSMGGGMRQSIKFDNIKRLPLVVPITLEQFAITSFLDQETSRIDTLISEKERLISLLQEYRQALISHAVTKGLDPKVKMKDSGVEWLGEVPEHWEVKRLKHIADVRLSNVDKHTVEGQKVVRLCNYLDVYNNRHITSMIDFMSATASDEQIERLSLQKDDVIITKDSEDPSDIGIPALVEEDIFGLVCGYHLAILRPTVADGKFLHYLLQSIFVRSTFEVEATGMTRYALGKYSIENLTFALPHQSEQKSIASFLHQETSRIDDLISGAKSFIELLKEYQSALITTAVTGKIDIRNQDTKMENSR